LLETAGFLLLATFCYSNVFYRILMLLPYLAAKICCSVSDRDLVDLLKVTLARRLEDEGAIPTSSSLKS
jgi:hypothetical protein